VSAWRVALEARKLGLISINVRLTAVRKLAVEAADNGLLAPAAGIAPHDLRRTTAELCRAAGRELEKIQLLLGHSSVQTTERTSARSRTW
jgi:integrase